MMPSSDEVAMSGAAGRTRRSINAMAAIVVSSALTISLNTSGSMGGLRRRKRSRWPRCSGSMAVALARSAVSPIVDRRTQLDRLRDLVEERASLAA
jgi:hypothetical protein